jgi:hypothetical protein
MKATLSSVGARQLGGCRLPSAESRPSGSSARCRYSGVELADLVRCKGRGVAPHALVSGIGEGVLGVELKLVDAERREGVHELEKHRLAGHAIPAHVEHVSAHGKVGPIANAIANAQGGKLLAVLSSDLLERARAVGETVLIGRLNVDTVLGDPKLVTFARKL